VNLLQGEWPAIVAIMAMVAATYATRVAGFWMMGHVAITPRVRRMLDALPGCVLAAILAPLIWRSGIPAAAGVAAAAGLMLLWRNEFVAVFVAIAVVALLRAAGL
jgi:uncharacterized membrane protein